MKNIAIVGGGACGVATFLELLIQITTHKLQDKVNLTLIEKDETIGVGLAFGTDQEGHLLNTQADLMGIFVEEPNHFVKWLDEHGGKSRKDVKGSGDLDDAYTARSLYGSYLADQFQHYLDIAKKEGIRVDLIKGEVVDIKSGKKGYTVSLEKKKFSCDYVVLALGTPKPNLYKKLRKYKAYVDFPYPASKILDRVDTGHSVGVLGTSLSAIDTIMTLIDNGYQGKIRLFSPEGLLPRVQPKEEKSIHRDILTLEQIHIIERTNLRKIKAWDLYGLYKQEVQRLQRKKTDWKSENRIGKDAHQLLKTDLKIAEKGGDAMMDVANSLRHDSATIWNWLNQKEKIRFKKWFSPHWAINRHGMPIPNAKRLLDLFEQGRLEVVPFITDAKWSKTEGKFNISTTKADYKVDRLINATGAASALSQMDSKLVQHMLGSKLLKCYPVGGAIINERTMQVLAPKAGEGLYAVGHLVNGILIDVNSVWYNVKTVGMLTQDIILKIRNGNFS